MSKKNKKVIPGSEDHFMDITADLIEGLRSYSDNQSIDFKNAENAKQIEAIKDREFIIQYFNFFETATAVIINDYLSLPNNIKLSFAKAFKKDLVNRMDKVIKVIEEIQQDD